MLSSFFESAVYFFMQEIWKKVTIEPFSEYYEVSNLGRVRSIDRYLDTTVKGKKTKCFFRGKILSPGYDGSPVSNEYAGYRWEYHK